MKAKSRHAYALAVLRMELELTESNLRREKIHGQIYPGHKRSMNYNAEQLRASIETLKKDARENP